MSIAISTNVAGGLARDGVATPESSADQARRAAAEFGERAGDLGAELRREPTSLDRLRDAPGALDRFIDGGSS